MIFRSQYRTKQQKHTNASSHTVNGAMVNGVDGHVVEVQTISCGEFNDPKIWSKAVTVTGMPSTEAASMLSRVGGALARMGAMTTEVRIILNFHPEASGVGLDLPVAIALLQSAGYIPYYPDSGEYLLFGSLDIHGQLRETPGALAMCFAARHGQKIICPTANSTQCVLAKVERDCTIHPADNLDQVMKQFLGTRDIPELSGGKIKVKSVQSSHVDFADIIGQKKMKRALEIAAAGSHSVLLVGPPGTGKTLSASALAGILPALTNSEKVELTKIWSAAGAIEDGQAVTKRPFRVVHHSATKQAIVGGGSQKVSIGEVTLAHRGVLFLDEVAEFRKDALESLRQPMEDGSVRISRTNHKSELPSKFSLVAAMNPCPCGYSPNCSCTPKQVDKYQSKLSGPLLDRIDIKVQTEPVDRDAENESSETSEQVRERVRLAVEVQRDRLAGTGYLCNSDVPSPKAVDIAKFSESAISLWKQMSKNVNLSMRLSDKVARVARTIADLERSEFVHDNHIREAFTFV